MKSYLCYQAQPDYEMASKTWEPPWVRSVFSLNNCLIGTIDL